MSSSSNPYAAPEAVVADVPATDGEPALATRMSRFLASCVDGILIILIAMLIGTGVSYLVPSLGFQSFGLPSPDVGLPGLVVWACICLGCFLALNYRLLASEGQTVGKRMMGIRILRSDGSRASVGWIILRRHLPMSVLGVLPYIKILTFIDGLLIFRTSRKCLHDIIADTIVVKV